MSEPEKPQSGYVGAEAAAKPSIGDANEVPVPAALATETSAAVAAVTEGPDSAVAKMREKLTQASPELLTMLETMTESATGVGVRTKDGILYELVFVWDSYGKGPQQLRLKRMLRVEGPSLKGTFEIANEFYVYASDRDPSSSIKENQNPFGYEAQQALNNNPALTGRLSVGKPHENGIRIVYTGKNGDQFVFFLGSSGSVCIYDPANRALNIPNCFDPCTVTPEELDSAIDAAKHALVTTTGNQHVEATV